MRPRGVVALACAVAASSAALVSSTALFASGASAFFHPRPYGRCHVTMHVPARIVAGESATVFGQLICRRGAVEGRPVRLFRHVPGVPGFVLVQTATTGAGGTYQFQLTGSVVENNGVWRVRARGAQSFSRRIRVAPQVTFEGPPEGTQLMTGAANKVTFTGKVTPADIGARVILQRQNALTGNEWHAIDMGGVVEAGGGYTITHTFVVPGDANLRVLVRSQGRNVPEASSPLSYEISQAQNSALTISATPDPIVYGGSVTIGGTLAGATSSQTVTLLARTVHQRGWAQVTQASTSGTGAYAFPAQAPANSTYYKVQGDGRSSAVVFEGVKYALTAEASPTSPMEGQVVTFSGKAAPVPLRPNHVIYLQRQNASGVGFHVVRVSVVGPEGAFSIPYQVFGVGGEVFRVYIPGGPDNGGAASQTFAISVAPAPAGR